MGYASYIDPGSLLDAGAKPISAVEQTIHHIEVYVGVFIGAVTLSGSVIAFENSPRASAASRCCCPRATGSTPSVFWW